MSLLTYACGPIATSSNSRRYRTCLFLGTVTSVITLLTLGHYPRANFHRYRSHLQEYIPTLSTSFSSPGQRIPCNPNEQVGFPDLETGVWTTLRPDCPGENFAKRLHATPKDERWESFPELRNTSVLFMGDSVGRQMFEFFCFLGQGEITRPAPPGWEDIHYGQSPRCLLPELGMEVAHIHTYSTINTSDPHAYNIMAKHFEGGEDWHLESRVDRFFATSLRDFVPDFVQLDSGPWDFRYWYTRDCLEGNRAEDLAVEDREEAAAIAVQTLHFLQNKFPRAKVWFQHPSIRAEGDYAIKVKVGNRVLGIKDNLKEDEYPPYYTHRRQAQYRATMKQRIKESGFDSLDYALLQEGIPFSVFFNPPDLTHPQHKAKLVMSNMILNLMARYIRYGV